MFQIDGLSGIIGDERQYGEKDTREYNRSNQYFYESETGGFQNIFFHK